MHLFFKYRIYNLRFIDVYTVESRFTTGLRSQIFGCKSNRRKTSTTEML